LIRKRLRQPHFSIHVLAKTKTTSYPFDTSFFRNSFRTSPLRAKNSRGHRSTQHTEILPVQLGGGSTAAVEMSGQRGRRAHESRRGGTLRTIHLPASTNKKKATGPQGSLSSLPTGVDRGSRDSRRSHRIRAARQYPDLLHYLRRQGRRPRQRRTASADLAWVRGGNGRRRTGRQIGGRSQSTAASPKRARRNRTEERIAPRKGPKQFSNKSPKLPAAFF